MAIRVVFAIEGDRPGGREDRAACRGIWSSVDLRRPDCPTTAPYRRGSAEIDGWDEHVERLSVWIYALQRWRTRIARAPGGGAGRRVPWRGRPGNFLLVVIGFLRGAGTLLGS